MAFWQTGMRGRAAALFGAVVGMAAVTGMAAPAVRAEPLALAPSGAATSSIFSPVLRDDGAGLSDPDDATTDLPARLRRQVVNFSASYPPGTIVIDTANTFLYLVLGRGTAMRYGIGVGREGFTWSGVETIRRMAEWPDWYPPAEMIRRQPYLPRFVAGGPGNPLGARALYLGQSQYRIHGTNDPSTIGRQVSSGCIRLTNADVSDLYARVRLGATVVVLPGGRAHRDAAITAPAASPRTALQRTDQPQTDGRAGATMRSTAGVARSGGISGLY